MSVRINKHRRLGMVVMLMLMLGLTVAVSVRIYYSDAPVLHTRLPAVGGLRVGAEVLISGFAVGHVVAIHPADLTVRAFDVTIRLDQAWRVPNDSTVALHQSNPIDVIRLNILPGNSTTPFQSGDSIAVAPSAPGLLDMAGQLAPRVTTALDKLGDAAAQAAATAAALNSLLGAAPGPGTPDAASGGVPGGVLGGVVPAGPKPTVSALLATTDGAISALREDIRKTLQTTRASLEQIQALGRHSDALMTQLSGLTADNSGDLRRMVRDGEVVSHGLARSINPLLDDLRTLTNTLNDLAQQMRDNPNALIFGRPPHDEPGQHSSRP